MIRLFKKCKYLFALLCVASIQFPDIYRFTKGLSCLGLFGEIQRHEELMKTLFVRTNYNLDAVGLELAFGTPSFSEEGSNRWRNELRTQLYWRDLLQDLEGWQYFRIIDA